MKESKLKKSAVVVAAAIVLASPAAVLAAAPSQIENVSTTVNFSDLNLNSEAGAKALYRRLQRASREVCGVESLKTVGSVSRLQRSNSCYREALSKAVADIDNDNLTRIHAG